MFIAVIVPQKFQRPFLFISLTESFRYHEYQSVIIFAVVKKSQLQNVLFSLKFFVDNPEEPVNTKESSIGSLYCGFICNVIGELIWRKRGDRVGGRGGGLLAY